MDNNVNLNDVSRISAGTVFSGEVTSSGDVRIDGKFDGRLTSKGRLAVGEKATVNGEVICQNVDFGGKMEKGTFYVADTLSLKSGCTVAGDLRYKRLQVDLDAMISGNLRALEENEFNKVARNGLEAEKPAAVSAKTVTSDATGKEE